MKDINSLVKQAHEIAKIHGWHDTKVEIPTALALIHSEISEALEDYRNGEMSLGFDERDKPVGFPSELADIVDGNHINHGRHGAHGK